MGTYASGRGQEASIVGRAAALDDEDWLFLYGREATAMLVQGVPLRDLLLYWRGVEDANKQAENDTFPPAIAIGTHVPVGVGFTWGMRLDGTDSIATLYHGEGHPSTSEYRPASTSRARPTRRRYSIKKQRENDGSPTRR
jgi:pyruvate dehydrogenase E1 component alpha subunit